VEIRHGVGRLLPGADFWNFTYAKNNIFWNTIFLDCHKQFGLIGQL
jgi:hypothetical protein